MIIYSKSNTDNNLSDKNQSKSKPKRIIKKNVKVKTTRSSKKHKLTKKNQIYLQTIGLKLKKNK